MYVTKELVHPFAVHLSKYGCTWKDWRALKKLEMLSAEPRSNSYSSALCPPNSHMINSRFLSGLIVNEAEG